MKNAKERVSFTDLIYFLAFGASVCEIAEHCDVTEEEIWAASVCVDLKGQNRVEKIQEELGL